MAVQKSLLGRQTGFTFNELLVAMSIVVVAVLGYSLGSFDIIRRQTVSDNSTAAVHLAQDKIESLQARNYLADVDVCPSGGDRGISATGGPPGAFDRCWRVSPSSLGAQLKQIDVTVTWRDHTTHQVTLSTLMFIGD